MRKQSPPGRRFKQKKKDRHIIHIMYLILNPGIMYRFIIIFIIYVISPNYLIVFLKNSLFQCEEYGLFN